jgi:hypothetical protein
MSVHLIFPSRLNCKTVLPGVDAAAAIYAVLTRVLEQAPDKNKLPVFALMAQQATRDLATIRQGYVDDLWWVGEQTRLVDLFGGDAVQAALSAAFEDARS